MFGFLGYLQAGLHQNAVNDKIHIYKTDAFKIYSRFIYITLCFFFHPIKCSLESDDSCS